ncbi:hypothetical protein C0J52_27800, partial [Blattella germanica]
EDIFPIENGELIRVPRKNPKLTSDAHPKIFPNQPSYHTVCVPKERKKSQERVQQLRETDETCFKSFKWILQSEEDGDLKCNKWTKFDNLVSHLNSFTDNSIRTTDKIINSVHILNAILSIDPDIDDMTANEIKFALEQLKLTVSKQIRYSAELLIWAATSEEEILLQFESRELLSYFKELNRGGLKCSSSIMISLCCDIFKVFQVLISSTYEADFLKLENQRDAVMTLGIELSENSISNLADVCKCGIVLKTVVRKRVKVLANIFINNYVKLLNEKNISKEIARKLESQNRKRCQLPSQDAGIGTKMTKHNDFPSMILTVNHYFTDCGFNYNEKNISSKMMWNNKFSTNGKSI